MPRPMAVGGERAVMHLDEMPGRSPIGEIIRCDISRIEPPCRRWYLTSPGTSHHCVCGVSAGTQSYGTAWTR